MCSKTKHKAFVTYGNLMVSRCIALIHLAAARGLVWVLEQPSSSLMQYHPRFQQLIRDTQVWSVTFPMGG